jgi:PKD repeat protein
MKQFFLFLFFLIIVGRLDISAQPAAFTYSQPSRCVPSTVTFTNTSQGTPVSYLWDFGDGVTTAVVPNPAHPYTAVGVYTATLIVRYASTTDTFRQSITVLAVPSFTFSKLNDSVCPGAAVSFSSSVSYPPNPNQIQSYSWDFGDGGTATSPNPTFPYMNNANQSIRYSVSLTVTDTNGCSHKVTQPNYVYAKPKPVVDFSSNQQVFCYVSTSPAVVNFTSNVSATTNNTYLWNFSDGTTSTAANPSHSFSNPGNYSISLTVTSAEGCSSTMSKTSYIQVIQYSIQAAVSDTIICKVPGTTVFQGYNGGATTYNWDFGDNTTGTTTTINSTISHTYAHAGTYRVIVSAKHASAPCYAYDTLTVHVYDSIGARMTITDSLMCDFDFSKSVGFRNTTPYPSNDDFGFGSTVWILGDGTTSNGDSVSHIYSNDTNMYNVVMKTTTPYGCVLDSIEGLVWYHSYVPINMVLTDGIGCIPRDITAFIVQEHWDIPYVEIIWNWGDGSALETTGANLTNHIYTDTGKFDITIEVTNEAGCTYQLYFGTVLTGIPPAAWFEARYVEQCISDFKGDSPLFVHAYDSLNSIDSTPVAGIFTNEWEWVYPDGFFSSYEPTTSLPINGDTGYITVTMQPIYNGCRGAIITKYAASYACPPTASSFVSPDILCGYPATVGVMSEVSFMGAGSIGATSYRWFFGDDYNLQDQSTDTAINVNFTYYPSPFLSANGISPGIKITLVAYNADSIDVNSPTYNRCKFCTDTAIRVIQIAEASMKFTSETICQEDSIRFYDSSSYTAGVLGGYFQLYPQDPFTGEHSGVRWYSGVSTNPNLTYPDNVFILPEGVPVYFHNLGNYTGILHSIDSLRCKWTDTIHFSVFPRSIPDIVSSKDANNFSFKQEIVCVNNPDSLYFRDISYTPSPFDTAKIIGWEWHLRTDSSHNQNPTLLDTVYGLHDVSLQITNEYGCVSTKVFKNYVLAEQIIPAFYLSRQVVCNNDEVEFHNVTGVYPSATPLTSTWDFGDGSPELTTQGIPDVRHTYHLTHTPQTIYVRLTVFADSLNCSETFIDTVLVGGVVAKFTDNGHLFPCPEEGRKIQFTNVSSGNPTGFYWNFGDSTSGNQNISNLKDPIHDYLHTGHYDVTLIVNDNAGCTDTLFLPQYVFIDGPIGDFTYGEYSGCVEHSVIFVPSTSNTDSVIVSPDRADQITEGGIHVNDTLEYTYTTTGAYVPYFYLVKWTDDNGTQKRCVIQWSGKDTIYVVDIVPDFATDSLYCSENFITFENRTEVTPPIVPPDSVIWDFGNGDVLNALHGSVRYDSNGIYTLTMTVYVKACIKQLSKTIEVISFPDFRTSPDSANACGNLEVSFRADSLSGIFTQREIQYRWQFDDGEILTGNPARRAFLSSGVYPYVLELFFDSVSHCSRLLNDTVYIQVEPFPVAAFEAEPEVASYGEPFQFIDKSDAGKGTIRSWYWDFGDNSSSALQNPKHAYTGTSGYIPVILRIENEFGCWDSIMHEVLILENLDFPNIFTPIGLDGKRYVFRPMEDRGYFKDFQLDIYNRWGVRIWSKSCTAPNCPDYSDAFWWDGCDKHGKLVTDGVYYWTVTAMPLSETKIFVKNGSVTVINAEK